MVLYSPLIYAVRTLPHATMSFSLFCKSIFILFNSRQVYYVCLFNHTKKSVLVVQGQLFVQSPLRVKSAKAKWKKANCTKKLAKEKHMQTAQITSSEI